MKHKSLTATMVLLGLVLALSVWGDSTTLTISNGNVTVTGSSSTTLDFPISRSGDTSYDAFVQYQTQDGTAIGGTDYTAAMGSLLLPAGTTSSTIPVTVAGSMTNHPDKTFQMLLLGGGGAARTFTPTFAAEQAFATGTEPYSVTAADVNGDGKPDLIVANYNDSTVSVLLNTTAPGAATPSFATQQTFAVGGGPTSVRTADLNGDGKPDLIVANSGGNTVSVLLNTTAPGASTPSFATQQTFATGHFPFSVVAADINGDGKPDLIVANDGSGTVSVLLNTTAPGAATPSFATQQTFVTGGLSSVTAADINGDGKPDLLVANSGANTVSVLLNTTAPGATTSSFAAKQAFAVGSSPEWVAASDVNGDGRPDLIAANFADHTISVLLNTTAPSAGTPSFATQQAFGVGSEPSSVAAADLNGDGRSDLIVANQGSTSVSVLFNTTAPGATTPSFTTQQTFATGTGPISVTATDLNGDGKPDLIATNGGVGTVSVLLNTTPAPATTFDGSSFATLQIFATAGNETYSVTTADLNGDGKPDLIVTNDIGFDAGTVSVLLNTTAPGASASSFSTQQPFAVSYSPFSVTAADVNGDGKPDLIVANYESDTVSVLLNTTAPGATTPSFATQQTFAVGSGPSSVTAADVNGDGKPDLIVTNVYPSDTVSVLLNTTAPGATTPSFAAQQTFAVGYDPYSVTAADVNGDGKLDLVVAHLNAPVSVLLNTTTPGATTASFATQQTFGTGSGSDSVTTADINDDGKPDLIVANRGSNTVSVLLNTTTPGATTPSFATQQTFATGAAPYSVTAADINGDGKPDLIVANYNDLTVSVLLNATAPGATTPTFAPQQTFVTDYPVSVSAADINGDGKPDLITASGSGQVEVLLNAMYATSASGSPAIGTIHFSVPTPSPTPTASATATATSTATPTATATATPTATATTTATATATSTATDTATTMATPTATATATATSTATATATPTATATATQTAIATATVTATATETATATATPTATPTATVITVNNTTDPASTSGNGFCTLREAINNANSPGVDTTGGDCIVGIGTDTIGFSVSGTIRLSSTLPAIANTSPGSLTIDGTGQTITVDGANSYQVLAVKPSATLNLNDLTIARGNASDGGGVFAAIGSTLTVSNSNFLNNSAGTGGGITSGATLTVSNSTFSGNSATAGEITGGGAIFGFSGATTVTNSAFLNNSAKYGGALEVDESALSVVGSTFSGNSASYGGGAIFNYGNTIPAISVTNSTFSANQAATLGGAIFNLGGTTNVTNSTFSANQGSGGSIWNQGTSSTTTLANSVLVGASSSECVNASGTISDGGYDISDDHSCGFTGTGANGQSLGDGVNPLLDPNGLQNNGGPTQTIALLSTSPAIDAIPPQCLTTDQRGDPRPAGGQNACDVGAFEGSIPAPTPTATASATATTTATPTSTATPTATATDTASATATDTTTATATSTATATPTATATATDTATPTATDTATATATATATSTATATNTPTNTATATATSTATATLTATATPTATATDTPTPTSTATDTATATATPTATPTTSISVATSLAMGNSPVGDTVTKNITVKNTGTNPLFIGSVTSSDTAQFAETGTTCPSGGLAHLATCTITIEFTPSALGLRSATLQVFDNTATSPQSVTLSGTGTVDMTVTPASYGFGSVKDGSKATAVIVVRNYQTNSVSLSESFNGPNAGDFSVTGGTCTSTLLKTSACSLIVAYAPTAVGTESAFMTVADSPDLASPFGYRVSFSALATIPESLSATKLVFGNVYQTASKTLSVTVTNNASSGPITLTGTTISGDFAVTGGNCGGSLAASSSCTYAVTFTPSTETAEAGTLSIKVAEDPNGGPPAVGLSGNGLTPISALPVAGIAFGTVAPGHSSVNRTVTVYNYGGAAVSLSDNVSITAGHSGDFAVTGGTCTTLPGGSLAGGSAHCTYLLKFTPSIVGSESATIGVSAVGDAASPHNVSLTGTGS